MLIRAPLCVVRFPNQLAFGSWLGERTPKKQGFQLWESFSQPTKFLVTKALQNWNKSCVNWRIWPLWKKFFHTLGHSSPLSPFLPFGHLGPPIWPPLASHIFICISDEVVQSYFSRPISIIFAGKTKDQRLISIHSWTFVHESAWLGSGKRICCKMMCGN